MNRVREVLDQIDKPNGLYPNYLNPRSGVWGSRKFNVLSSAVYCDNYIIRQVILIYNILPPELFVFKTESSTVVFVV